MRRIKTATQRADESVVQSLVRLAAECAPRADRIPDILNVMDALRRPSFSIDMDGAPRDGTPVVLVGFLPGDTRVRATVSHWAQRVDDNPAGVESGWFFAAPGYTDRFHAVAWAPLPEPPQ